MFYRSRRVPDGADTISSHPAIYGLIDCRVSRGIVILIPPSEGMVWGGCRGVSWEPLEMGA